MERRPSSLLVAACISVSVRIHRPTTVNPVVVTEQSAEERPPVRLSRYLNLLICHPKDNLQLVLLYVLLYILLRIL